MASSLHVHPVAEQSGDKEQGICTRKKRTEEISLSKQNKWQLFSSLLLTLASKMRMMENMNSRFGTVNWLKVIVYDSPDPQTYDPYTVSFNQPLHCSICYHGGRTWMSLSLYNNFLLMGLQTISCFLSVLLVWPLAESLPQQSTKTQDKSPLLEWESRKRKKEISTRLVVSLESWAYSKFLAAL